MTEDVLIEPRKPGRPPRIDKTDDAVKGTTPGWRPSALLGTLIARSGFSARWVKNDPAHIAKMRSEGWITMKEGDNVGLFKPAEDATGSNSLSGEIRYRDMIGMMIPNHLKKQRTEYYSRETQSTMNTVLKQTDRELKQKGVSTYTPKGMAGRIVIE